MSKVLLTGFQPFAEFRSNPSQQVVERLHGQPIAGAEVVGLVLPVEFGVDAAKVFPAIEELRPSLVLSMGLAAGATCLHVERLALNLRQCEGREVPIIPNAPAAYFATIDVDQAVEAMVCRGVPAQAHVGAGTYLCNHIMYQTLHHAASQGLEYRAGFIHLPLATEQVVAEGLENRPSLSLKVIAEGVRAAIEAAFCQEAKQ